MNKLRIGVVLSAYDVPAWVRSMLESIKDSSYAEVSAVVIADRTEKTERPASKMYLTHFNLDLRIHHPAPNPWVLSDIRTVLHTTQILGESLHERIPRLKALRLDLLLNLSLDELPKTLLDVARFGVWTLRCNDARVTTSTEIGWLEIFNSNPLMQCMIEIQRLEITQLIPGSVMATHTASITLNQKSFFWRASQVVPRLLWRMQTKGEQVFFSYALSAPKVNKIGWPTYQQSMTLVWKQLKSIFENKVWRRWFPHRWVLMIRKNGDQEPFEWRKLSQKVPPRSVYWADPFILKRQDKSHLFYEEYLYKIKRGRISCAVIDEAGNMTQTRVALERPYHLSYPYIFEYRGEYFMIPETAQNRTIEAYRCKGFPDQWEYHMTLMTNVQAVDTTLVEYSMRWWMFVNVAARGGSTWDELHLFYSDDPLSSDWTSHPLNPIISDVRAARPAGGIFRRDGWLIRPSQDCSRSYGLAINLNRIIKMTIHEYEEELIERIEPSGGEILGVHTYNKSEDMIVVDARKKNKFR